MSGPPPAAPAPSDADERGYVPRWLRFAPFLGRPPALTRRQWRVLGLVAAASLFDQYDLGLFSLALKQIQAELGIAEDRLGWLGAIVIFGALPSSLLALAADRFGRRRLLLVTIVAYTLLTGATAFAPSAEVFIALQFLARTFITAEIVLAMVVVAEEFDADSRGWGIGALSALALCGHGLALALFSLVEVLPFGWRSLYAVGLVPLVLIAVLRRDLPETPHFERHAAARGAQGALGGALPDLVRVYPGRAVALGTVAFLLASRSAPPASSRPSTCRRRTPGSPPTTRCSASSAASSRSSRTRWPGAGAIASAGGASRCSSWR